MFAAGVAGWDHRPKILALQHGATGGQDAVLTGFNAVRCGQEKK